ITEVLRHIFSYLDQQTLKLVAAQVNRQWHLVAHDFIRHQLYLNQFDPKKTWTKKHPRHRQILLSVDKLTVGRKIGPWWSQDYNLRSKNWRPMIETLVEELTALQLLSNGSNNNRTSKENKNAQGQLRIKVLHLNLQPWQQLSEDKQQQTMFQLFNAENLQEISLDLPFVSRSFGIRWLLDTCPNLLRLSITFLSWIFGTPALYGRPWLQTETVPSFASAWEPPKHTFMMRPLQSLRLHSASLSFPTLEDLLPELVCLEEIYLLNIQNTETFEVQSARAQTRFWETLKSCCPNLEAIHFHVGFETQASSIPMASFPKVHDWGIDQKCVKPTHPTWEGLMNRTITTTTALVSSPTLLENRITDLNLYRRQAALQPPRPGPTELARDQLIHRFLCSAPCLLSFKAGQISLSLDVFWGGRVDHLTRPILGDTSSTWACRGLKLLYLRVDDNGCLDSDDSSNRATRRIFAYLSRVCPRLEQLSIDLVFQLYSLESGLCLLTRMEQLRRLSIYTFLRETTRRKFSCQPSDFAWIQGYSTGKDLASSLPPSSFLWKNNSGDNDREQARNGYQDCLEAIKKLSILENASELWTAIESARVKEQQEKHLYATDYDRPRPMVDGVSELGFMTSVDIEARLRSQIYRLDQETQENMNSERLVVTKPWPYLQRLVLSCGSCKGLPGRIHEHRAGQALKMLRRMRPEIEFCCQYSEHPHHEFDLYDNMNK
ncbi:hypothetical protein BGZ83_002115, partial [Gryganskiella cystojenkinii]